MTCVEVFHLESNDVSFLELCESRSYSLHVTRGGDAKFIYHNKKLISFFQNKYYDRKLQQLIDASIHSILSTSITKVTIVQTGVSIVAFGCSNSTAWTIGLNTLNPTVSQSALQDPALQQVATGINVSRIAVGYSHLLLVDASGGLYSLGRGQCGQLGIGRRCDWVETATPVPVSYPLLSGGRLHGRSPPLRETVVDAAAGSLHSAVVTATGRVYTFGCGASCRLGQRQDNGKATAIGNGAGPVDITPPDTAYRPGARGRRGHGVG